ncbi:hypothetical protein BKA61DRAFT_669139 [Leptodontidium sp. MPI-SDFR-AT-0119]|nr:hypothetical protein BKA61DRAFT_669139 [Leptodontidium sp. MPI-SDFR-AT-0119]
MEQPPQSSMTMLLTIKPRYPNRLQDWETHKSEIEDLYHQKTQAYIMRHMEQLHTFRATKKQWKSQLKKWGLKKRTERDEYRAILKLKRQREDHQPDRTSEFSLRGKTIPPAKIARFKTESLKNGLIAEDNKYLFRSCDPTGLVQDSIQLVPTSPLRTPSLRPFDWWRDFADFNIPQSPAILKGPSSNRFVRLLAPLGQKINNIEDEHIFRDLVIKSRQEFRCVGCRVNGIISSIIHKYLTGDVREPNMFERFVGAAIQKLNELMELSDYQFGAPSTSVGAALLQLGRNAEALPLLIEGLKDAEPDLSHNDLAQYRLKVALCHSELGQIENAVEQLCLAFGSEFRRLAILAPDSDCLTRHTTGFDIISKLMEYEESHDGGILGTE